LSNSNHHTVPEEGEAQVAALFNKIDANHDRALTKEELITLCKSSGLDNGEAAAKCLEGRL
jgi:hypothetical protein